MAKAPGKFINIKGSLSSADNNFRYGTNVKCKLKLEILKDVEINFLTVKVYCEVRGVVEYDPIVIHREKLSGKDCWLAGEILNYEFSFCPDKMITYKGSNIQFSWYVETDVDLASRSKKSVRKDYVKDFSVLKAFSPEAEYDKKMRFTVLPNKYNYVPQEIDVVENTSQNYLLYAIPIGLLILALISGYYMLLILVVISSGGLGIQAYFKSGFHIYKTLKISSRQKENNYHRVKIEFGTNWQRIESLDFYYEAREYVKDRRGTTTTIHEKVIGRTKYLRIKDVKKENTFNNQVKSSKIPGSFNEEDMEIQWFLIFRANRKNGKSNSYEIKTFVDLNPFYIAQ